MLDKEIFEHSNKEVLSSRYKPEALVFDSIYQVYRVGADVLKQVQEVAE